MPDDFSIRKTGYAGASTCASSFDCLFRCFCLRFNRLDPSLLYRTKTTCDARIANAISESVPETSTLAFRIHTGNFRLDNVSDQMTTYHSNKLDVERHDLV